MQTKIVLNHKKGTKRYPAGKKRNKGSCRKGKQMFFQSKDTK